ncbi:MAG: peptide deformylase [Candidatus Bipolaricaulota bacterium]
MIRLYPDPCLRVRAGPLKPGTAEAREACRVLRQAFAQVEGLGLAATQLGLPHRALLVQVNEEQLLLLNPEITARSEDMVVDSEGCLSLPGLQAGVARAEAVQVAALGENGSSLELSLEGLEARVIQHEIDHLDGVLFVDHIPAGLRKQLLTGYRAQPEEATSRT